MRVIARDPTSKAEIGWSCGSEADVEAETEAEAEAEAKAEAEAGVTWACRMGVALEAEGCTMQVQMHEMRAR